MFKAITNASGTRLSGEGMLNVLQGKYRITERVIKKDSSPIKGIEFVLSIANGKGIAFQKWNNDLSKYADDDTPKVYPLTVSIFLPETDEVGKSFINLFANLKNARLDEKIAEGFTCPNLALGEVMKYTSLLADDDYWTKGDFKKIPQALEMICEDIEAIECTDLDFPVTKTSGNSYGSTKSETQIEKTKARIELIEQFLTPDSEIQKSFVKFSALQEVSALEFLALVLG
jgi:hypothetical protein